MARRKKSDNRIEIRSNVMLGKPVVRGTRITVELLIEKLAAGRSIPSILRDDPALERDDVLAALAYARRVLGVDPGAERAGPTLGEVRSAGAWMRGTVRAHAR